MQVLVECFLGPGGRNDLTVRGRRGLRNQVNAVLILRVRIIRIGINGLFESRSSRFELPDVYQHRTEVVIVLPGTCRVDLRGLFEFGLRFSKLLLLG